MKEMKKGSIIIICLVFAMSFSMNVCAASNPGSSKVNSLYKTFLSGSEAKISNSYTNTICLKNAYFTSIDIDGNGVKELIVKEKSSSYGVCNPVAYVFTIKNKKVVYAGSTSIKQDYSNSVQISRKYKSIYSCYPVASYTPTYFYTLKKGKLYNKKFFYVQYGYGKSTYGDIPHESWCKSSGYFINKKKVPESKYNSEYQKYMKSLKKYLLVANTERNRNRKLK